MPIDFLTEDFLLSSDTARYLYHQHAAKMPIYDYHCHISPQQVAEDKQFDNITQVWLYGDHYKWRAMRACGVDEKYITGNASDWEKFQKWAETVPSTVRNPLYHWTHMELKKPFGVTKLLSGSTAKEIYEATGAMLKTRDFRVRGIMRKANVAAICTTDDPIDSLEHHQKIAKDGFEIKVMPAWRPDKGMATEDLVAMNAWIDKLAKAAAMDIKDYGTYIAAIRKRHDYFHQNGCRLSDHGVETAYAKEYTETELKSIFARIRSKQPLAKDEHKKFKSAMLYEFALMDHEKGWVQQFHFGALRNNNTRMLRTLGPDTGYDCIGDFEIGKALCRFLNRLEEEDKLTKTIVYNLNPRDNELLATMMGSFQSGGIPGKMQFGSGWWFLDQKDGMIKQLNALSNMGVLAKFVGMLTDSRSFLSYPRHEYFRRILCNLLGADVEAGELPNDRKLLGKIVEDICFNNARDYFGLKK
jgi:glucuronate isomerase